MKNIYQKLILFALLTLVFAGCSENEIAIYDQSPRIVFVSVDGDSYMNFIKNYNFTSIFTPTVIDSVQVRLQGVAQIEDLNIYIDLDKVDDYDSPDIEFLNNPITIPAGDYTTTLYFKIKSPASTEQVLKGELVIDYETSGLEPGITERSKFEVSAWNEFKYEWGTDKYLKITLEDYNTYLTPILGPPTAVKIRFFTSYPRLASYYPDLNRFIAYVQAGLESMLVGNIINALDEYNEENPDNPLTDENGNLVTIP